MDIQAALRAGASALGVATGIASISDLEAAAAAALVSEAAGSEAAGDLAAVVLPGLQDTEAVLAALELA
jgi:hypothetical protein